jgi:hypothetical protein
VGPLRAAAGVALLVVVAVSTAAASAPPHGATAVCRDGTYSYSHHRSGTCSHHGGVARWLAGPSGVATTATGRSVVLGVRTRSRGCRRGALPDRRCTPGAYYAKVTKRLICAPGFHTSSIRNVPPAEKFAVEAAYGMQPRLYGRTIELDHVVPLELGGSNAVSNLFPERGSGVASYHVKDRLEDRLHTLVCTGRMSLAAARRGIAVNWLRFYDSVFGVSA